MKTNSQMDRIIKVVKSLTRENELQAYLRDNIPYEDLLDSDFITQLTKINPAVKRVLEGVLIDKEYEQAQEYEQQADLETNEGFESYMAITDIHVVLAKHRHRVLKLARFYEEEGNYAKAQKYYNVIVEQGRNRKESFIQKYGQDDKDTIYYKARIGELACKSNMKQDLTDEEKDELADYLKRVSSQERPIEAFLTYFTPIPTAQLLSGNFDEIMRKGGTRKPRSRNGQKQTAESEREYITELTPDKRLKYIVDNYEIARAYTGLSAFEGSIVFDISDKNILIVEKFYEPMYEGEIVPRQAYGSSTIVVNKDIELNIEEMTRGKLVEMNQTGNKQIGRLYHKGESYYERLARTVEKVSVAGKSQQVEQVCEDKSVSRTDAMQEVETPKTNAPESSEMLEEQSRGNEQQEGMALQIVLEEMENLDSIYDSLQATLENARREQEKIQKLREAVANIKAEVQAAVSGKITREISAIVLEQKKTLTNLRQELTVLEQSVESIDTQECELEIAKNREKREKLKEEVNKMLGE